jgi:pimeloyl-ACP methyl ester carboxylesterase
VESSATASSAAAQDYGCLTPDQVPGAYQLKLSEQPATADAFAAGHGKVGVVLAHMAGESVCEWAPWVSKLAAEGYLATTFTSVGPTDANVGDAITELRRRGATKVLLVGGSKGGTAVLVAASRPQALPVEAVVSLSGPAQYEGMDAGAAAPTLTMPVLFMADADDSPFNDDAKSLAAAAKRAPVHLLKLYPGTSHASAVLGDPTALTEFTAFIAKYAPPSGA